MSTNGAARPRLPLEVRRSAKSVQANRGGKASAAAPTPPPEIEHTATNCRAREMIVRVADKWSMYVIHVLADAGPLRFGGLRHRVDGVSQRMLTVTLRGLERDGLVRRTMYPEVPPRVEYALTPLGVTLRTIVRALIKWSGAHLAEVDAARARFDAKPRHWAEDGKSFRAGKPSTETDAYQPTELSQPVGRASSRTRGRASGAGRSEVNAARS